MNKRDSWHQLTDMVRDIIGSADLPSDGLGGTRIITVRDWISRIRLENVKFENPHLFQPERPGEKLTVLEPFEKTQRGQ